MDCIWAANENGGSICLEDFHPESNKVGNKTCNCYHLALIDVETGRCRALHEKKPDGRGGGASDAFTTSKNLASCSLRTF